MTVYACREMDDISFSGMNVKNYTGELVGVSPHRVDFSKGKLTLNIQSHITVTSTGIPIAGVHMAGSEDETIPQYHGVLLFQYIESGILYTKVYSDETSGTKRSELLLKIAKPIS